MIKELVCCCSPSAQGEEVAIYPTIPAYDVQRAYTVPVYDVSNQIRPTGKENNSSSQSQSANHQPQAIDDTVHAASVLAKTTEPQFPGNVSSAPTGTVSCSPSEFSNVSSTLSSTLPRTPRKERNELLGLMANMSQDASVKKKGKSDQDKEREKSRLQDIVRDFSKRAVQGMPLQVIDPESVETSSQTLTMDKYLNHLTIQRRKFEMKDLTAIYRGTDVAQNAPNLAIQSSCVVGLDFCSPPDSRIFCLFKDGDETDKFFTCFKILRMSVDITGRR
jgi:hypothetical protein